jgi:hypothetical protein
MQRRLEKENSIKPAVGTASTTPLLPERISGGEKVNS